MRNAYWTAHNKENASNSWTTIYRPECSGHKAAKENVSKVGQNLNDTVTKEIKMGKENRFGRQ